jgi:hypothetical protein
MAVGISKNSVFAIREEVTAGTLIAPSAAAQFVPLRPGNEMNYTVETLDNEELNADIGAAKKFKGKESVEGTHSAYIKHSGVEGQEPQVGILYESVFGDKTVNATEYDTTTGSSVSAVVMPVGEGANFYVGQALLIKDSTNGYSVRNISSISTDTLNLNFNLDNAPASGVNLGRAITYKPVGSGHPTFSGWKYDANGHAVQAAAGCTVSEISAEFPVNEFASVEFSYQGTKYFYNPIEITSSTRFFDFNDGVDRSCSVPVGFYRDPMELATALQTAINDSPSAFTATVTFSSVTGLFNITFSSAASIEFATGANTANTIATKIGFAVADSSSAISHTSANAQTYVAPFTPAYDSSDPVVVKDAELFIGSSTDNVCLCATSATVTISKEVEDVDCICEETGTKEKIATGRAVSIEAELVLEKHQVRLFNNLLNNTSIQAMLNAGPKSSGNWIPGKCVNVYLRNAVVSEHTIGGDSFITASVVINGFVAASSKDVYWNFI